MDKKKILIFTGAGIDKESGISTFRDSKDGLWNNYKIEDVASIQGWKKDKSTVLDFYNQRRREMKLADINIAHKIVAELENDFDVTVVTQNVSDLHERAGSTDVIHLHGELSKVRSTFNDEIILDWDGDLVIGDKCPEGGQLRPHIVWFGEILEIGNLHYAKTKADEADICIVVGTSMQVYPANTIPFLTGHNTLIYYVDPGDAEFEVSDRRKKFFKHIKEPASTGMVKVKNDLDKIFNNEREIR